MPDALGEPHPPHRGQARIVSLVPSITECLIDLGLGRSVVGRTTFCIHPAPAVAGIARVGGTKTPRLDRILALEPTHVVMNVDENRLSDAEALRAAGVRVIVTHPLAPEDNLALYRLLGAVFGVRAQAQRLACELLVALDALERRGARAPRRTALYLIWREPWMTVSRDTYISRMLAIAHLETFEPDTGERYPQVALTPGALAAVDVILLPSEPFPFKAHHAQEIRDALGVGAPPVKAIDGEMVSWYGSRAVHGCRYLAAFLDRL